MLIEKFEEQVRRFPRHIAIKWGDGERTYDALNRQVNRLARAIIGCGDRNRRENSGQAALLFEQGGDMIVALLAALKVGLAYVPLDATYPDHRLADMLEDARVSLLLTDRENRPAARRLQGGDPERFDILDISRTDPGLAEDNLERQAADHRLAYILYTSGSTGRPKGVMQTHRNVLYYIRNWTERFHITPADRLTLVTAFIHDGACQDIFAALLNGATLFPFDIKTTARPRQLVDLVVEQGITIWHSVPTLFRYFTGLLTGEEDFSRLRWVLLGGEPLRSRDMDIFRRHFTRSRLANIYGQTESSVNSIWMVDGGDRLSTVVIGEPLDHTEIMVVQEDGSMVEDLGVGEIVVACDHLAPGYWMDTESTEKRFTRDPHLGTLYWTGDLGGVLEDGSIELLGRRDSQVKLRGFRIETGEIETRLLRHQAVREAAVKLLDEETDEPYLCAYLAGSGPVDYEVLRDFLWTELPDYMIPGRFVWLDTMPLTASGKIDFNALPLPEREIGEAPVLPRNEREAELAEIWSEILGIEKERIGIDANFFQLGGHSLKATAVAALAYKKMSVKLPLIEIFRSPTIRKLAALDGGAAAERYAGIEPVEAREYYPLSSAQKRLYFLQQLDLTSTSYNMPLALPLDRNIDSQKLQTVLKGLIDRHESLRTSFIEVDGLPVQRIHQAVDFEIEYRQSRQDFLRPFDLSRAPLIRSAVVLNTDGPPVWLVDMHHVITDGTSQAVLAEDFVSLYNGRELTPLRLQYKDFSQWQNRLFTSETVKSQWDYWLRLFRDGGVPERLDLPADYPRPPVFNFSGGRHDFSLGEERSTGLQALGIRHGATLYMNLLAALSSLFFKYSGLTDIVVGSAVAGRPHADLQHLIGMLVNTLAMRNFPEGEKTYESFLQEVITVSLQAFDNQDIQFDELVDRLDLSRDPSRNPLFDVSLVVQNFRVPGEDEQLPMPRRQPAVLDYRNPTAKVDLTFLVREEDGDVQVAVEYYTGLFAQVTIRRLEEHIKRMIDTVLRDPAVKLKNIEIISNEEKKKILETFNQPADGDPSGLTIHERFEARAEHYPDRPALECRDLQLTYSALDRLSSRLSGYLCRRKGLKVNEVVGVWLDSGVDMVAALLGIMKAGGAYLPIDPAWPGHRKRQVIVDTGTGIVLSEKRYIRDLNRLQWDCSCFRTFICLDSRDVRGEEEEEKSGLMDRQLWDHVVGTADDEITAGGWVSSYTGRPFSAPEMAEYGDNVLKKLAPVLNSTVRVLEIGCGSGITMFRIAPSVARYYGTDLSAAAVERNRQRIDREKHDNIVLACLAAHEIDRLKIRDVDIVIINSVIQAFHGHNYLRQVITRAIDLMVDRGCLFIGDVMDLEKRAVMIHNLEDFKRDHRNRDYKTRTEFDDELFLSREFWLDLAADFEGIEKVEFSDKIHTIANELTRFRYDVLLTVDKRTGAVRSGKRAKYQEDLNALDPVDQRGNDRYIPDTSAACIIYTSGTTGQPRGVPVGHRGILNYIDWRLKNYGYVREDITLQLLSFAFDGFASNLYSSLLCGGRLVLIGGEKILDYRHISGLVRDRQVTNTSLVPGMYELLLDHGGYGFFNSLRLVVLAGERAPVGLVKRSRAQYPAIRLVNEYGPTESTVTAAVHPQLDESSVGIIGRPIDNVYIYIVDRFGCLQPVGTAGELAIAGSGVVPGYLNQPELTAERFSNTHFPLSGFGILYRTGDRGRWLEDGSIELSGRLDQQIKIRGFRIEPGEIEDRLARHEAVKEAVVTAGCGSNGDRYLAAYIVPAGTGLISQPSGSEAVPAWHSYLGRFLPPFMIPDYFQLVERIPLTLAGKTDFQALPDPLGDGDSAEGKPADYRRQQLLDVCREVLGRRGVKLQDNFFEAGGNSLKTIRLAAEITRRLGIELPITQVFKTPVLKDLADFLLQRAFFDSAEEPMVLLSPPHLDPLFCFPPGIGYGIAYMQLANLLQGRSVYAFNFIEDEDRLNRYADIIREIQPRSPYRLLGYSAGGKLCFKVAEELAAQGAEVTDIILLDSFGCGCRPGSAAADAVERKFIDELTAGLERFDLSHLKERVVEKVKKYRGCHEQLPVSTPVEADIHLIQAETAELDAGSEERGGDLPGRCTLYQGRGTHGQMLSPGFVDANALIIEGILANRG